MRPTIALVLCVLLVSGGFALAAREDPAPPASNDAASTSASPASEEPTGTTMPWALIDCSFVVAFGVAPTDAVQARLPDGFTARSVPARYAEGAPRAGTLVGIESEVCKHGTGLAGETIEDQAYTSVWVGVTPPPEHRVDGFDGGYYVNWDPMIPDADRRAAFHDAGVPAHDGVIEITPLVDGLGPRTARSTYTLDGLGAFQVDAATPEDPTGGLAGSFYQWTEAEDGDLARWRVDWSMETFHQGPGVVELPAGSWLVDLFGSETIPAPVVYTGTWDYTDGRIWLPV